VRQGRALSRCGLIKKTAEGQPQQAIMAAFDTETYCKIVVVVDEDIDIFDLADVMWVVATRSRADRALVFATARWARSSTRPRTRSTTP
jgi:UbiD family decarboxylase